MTVNVATEASRAALAGCVFDEQRDRQSTWCYGQGIFSLEIL